MTFTEQFVAFTLATLNIDGKCDPKEVETIKRIAGELQLEDFDAVFAKEQARPTKLDDVMATISNKDDAELILESCVQVALADEILDSREISLLLLICRLLKLPVSACVTNIAIACQNNRSIKIEGSDSDFDADTIEMDEENN